MFFILLILLIVLLNSLKCLQSFFAFMQKRKLLISLALLLALAGCHLDYTYH